MAMVCSTVINRDKPNGWLPGHILRHECVWKNDQDNVVGNEAGLCQACFSCFFLLIKSVIIAGKTILWSVGLMQRAAGVPIPSVNRHWASWKHHYPPNLL